MLTKLACGISSVIRRGDQSCLAKQELKPDCGCTTNGPALWSAPPGVVTWILPVVAPVGTVAVISVRASTLKAAGVPA